MQRRYSLILTLLLTFSLTHIVGADTGEPQSGRRIPPQQSPTSGPTPMVLRLDDLLRQVDLYHPKLQGADAERRVASAKRLEKQGAFDPVFLLGSDYLRYNSTSSRGKQLDASQNDLQVEFLTRSGIKVFAGTRLNVGTVKSPLSSTGDAGEYFLGVKIPLMRSFRINEKAAAEKQAKIGEPLADAEFQEKRLELFQKAATSYWEWVGAKRRLDVSRNLLELARIRAEAIRERVKAGDLPQIDSTEADQEVERRRGSLLKSDRDLQKATFKLALFLWEPDGNPSSLPTAASVPAVTSDPVEFGYDQQLLGRKFAIERRPELKSVRLNRDISQVDLDLARNQRMPAVDLSFQPGRDTGFDSIGNTLKFGVSVTFPFRQRTIDGRIAQSQLKIQKFNFEEAMIKQQITNEVDDTVSAINMAYQRYLVAEKELILARQLEQGERDRFALGDSTIFLVNQRERAAAEAEIKLIDTQIEYEQAVANFRAATVQF